ncbi:MAG: beta-lactamase family protein [Betaproteobacteria bacterium]|nr:MAG: beta-lactamase family protein [Betaproteobacteria bacterium]
MRRGARRSGARILRLEPRRAAPAGREAGAGGNVGTETGEDRGSAEEGSRRRQFPRRGGDGGEEGQTRLPGCGRDADRVGQDDPGGDLPHLFDDQAAGIGGGDDAGRGRRDPAHRSGEQVPAGFRQAASERPGQGCFGLYDLYPRAAGAADDARNVAPAEQIEKMATVPLAFQPGTTWNYSLSVDMLGRVVERASGKRLADFLEGRLFKPLRMKDSGFWVPAAKMPRLAESLERDRFAGRAFPLIDVSAPPKNDSGGAGGVSTAADYLRFCQMMMNGGTLDGAHILSRTTVKLMTSDHLGNFMQQPMQPGELLLGTKGYSFGLGFAVRVGDGVAGVPGSAGEYMWAGYAGTYFWVDPKEQVTAVLMTQAASPQRAYFRKLVKQLVYQAITD